MDIDLPPDGALRVRVLPNEDQQGGAAAYVLQAETKAKCIEILTHQPWYLMNHQFLRSAVIGAVGHCARNSVRMLHLRWHRVARGKPLLSENFIMRCFCWLYLKRSTMDSIPKSPLKQVLYASLRS